ncbi:HypC/HybG/HupF family hydrogenase formation chaperone [Oryzibacter oryziterrae]|uniref:HypC/HybG/HupF family hydrogenase formation chaperone n=1 Tax=Oryzibacter oryziterrae TaxID=2766474 RepID=UPI001F2800AC|nr:HypC/HybG/HupF family hydrogenase formation chaperone [Oryzibacter oryziterrae]
MCLAVPALVTEILDDNMAKITLDGVKMTISTLLVKNVQVGDYVIVHVGHALSRVDPEEAKRTLELLAEARDFALSAGGRR